MKEKNKNVLNLIISWFFLLYFVILFVERVQSIIRIISGHYGFFETAYDGYVNIIVILSLVASIILLVLFCKDYFKSLFVIGTPVDYSKVAYVSGVILISGMHHTAFTIAAVQFVSYGMLIVAMILKTVVSSYEIKDKFKLWYSLVYLILFSMAIPVMYHSFISAHTAFHIIEAIAALVLVAMFTTLLRLVFVNSATDLLYIFPLVTMVVFDAVLIIMRWDENVNVFLLIFASLSLVSFVLGKILFKKS